ncbi:MAG: radical SAM protein [Candidatus Uhrbacteria bacterium]
MQTPQTQDCSAPLPLQTVPLLEFLWLEVTKRCNLACQHCYVQSSPSAELTGTMTEQDWIGLIGEARDVGCKGVQFIGGEPLLHPSFQTLLRAAHASGMDVEVFTNATFLKEDVADLFRELGTRVAVSVYAEDADTHDRVTMRSGSHAATEKGIRNLVDRGVKVRVGVIEQGENADRIDQALAYVRSLGVTEVGVDHVRAVGRGERDGSTGWKEDPMAALCGQCYKGRLAVDINGDSFPCVFGRAFPTGNVHAGLRPILEGLPLSSFSAEMIARQPKVDDDSCDPKEICRPNCHPGYCQPKCAPNH